MDLLVVVPQGKLAELVFFIKQFSKESSFSAEVEMFCRKVSISKMFWQKSLERNVCFDSFVLFELFFQCFSEVAACL